MRIFVKLSGYLFTGFKVFKISTINWIQQGMSVNFFSDTLHMVISTRSAKFSEFDAENVI